MLIKFLGKKLGKVYHGLDGTDSVTIRAGDELEVSAKMAKRLLEDFPEDFEQGTGKPPVEPKSGGKK